MPARSFGDALSYYLRTNNRRDAPAVQGYQQFTAKWLGAEALDASLSSIRLPGGELSRGVPKLSSVTGLSTGDPVTVTIQPGGTAVITGKPTGDAGLNSSTWKKTTSITAPTAPGTPTVGSPTTTSVSLSWTPSTDNSGTGLAGYQVFDTANGLVGTPDSTSLVVTGLSPGTSYSFKVQSRDNTGHVSAFSNVGTGSTSNLPTPNPSNPLPYTYQYAALWSGSYNYYSSGEYDSNLATQCSQGQGNGGNTASLIGFDSTKIVSDASGYIIVGQAYLTLTYATWELLTGGAAVIGTHTASGLVQNLSQTSYISDQIESANWQRGERRQIALGTTICNQFLSGAIRGIILGPGPGVDSVYDGFAYGAGTGANQPVLTLNFSR